MMANPPLPRSGHRAGRQVCDVIPQKSCWRGLSTWHCFRLTSMIAPVRLIEQYYRTPKKDRKVFLGNLREEDREIVQKFVDKAQVILVVEALNEMRKRG